MNQIWNTQEAEINPLILEFTTDCDPELDAQIFFPYDLIATLAHGKMLYQQGLIFEHEFESLKRGIKKLEEQYEAGKFKLKAGQEDGHTAIEDFLTIHYGSIGEKIHTARSRNDQSLTMIRLYQLDQLATVSANIGELVAIWQNWSEKFSNLPMPGYTHQQKAMPTTVGAWQQAYADALIDQQPILSALANLLDQSPLGSGAGYGLPIEIDRELTAKELCFSKVQSNPIYCQLSRGLFSEQIVANLNICGQIISRWANDLLLFTTSEYNFFKLPPEFCTGSSIMPQKQNYDVLEIIRAKAATLSAAHQELQFLNCKLHSGYNRDSQLGKKPLVTAFKTTNVMLKIAALISPELKPNLNALKQAMTPDLYKTEEVYKLVKSGLTFREAYKQVKAKLK